MDEKITRINKNPYVGCTVTLLVDYDVHLAAGTEVRVERVLLPLDAVAVLHPTWLFLVWFMREQVELERN